VSCTIACILFRRGACSAVCPPFPAGVAAWLAVPVVALMAVPLCAAPPVGGRHHDQQVGVGGLPSGYARNQN